MCVPKQQITFYEELISIQSGYKERLWQEELFPKPDKNQALKGIKNGLPLISFEGIKIKEETVKDILDDVCNSLIRHGLCKEEEIEQLKTVDSARLKTAVLEPDKGINSPLSIFIFTNVARIILGSIVDELKSYFGENNLDTSQWLQGYCPMCGGLPLIAKLRKEDGKRFLQCSICFTEWQFTRIRCVYCGSEDQKDLRFFWVDETSPTKYDASTGYDRYDTSYRVDVCDKCKGYIKTVDERKIEEGREGRKGRELNPLIEDINTAYLDILAANAGYRKPCGSR